MSVVNTSQYVLASTRVANAQRALMKQVATMEIVAMVPVEIEELIDLAEQIHTQSIELLEHCEELARAMDPSWGRK